MRLSNHYNTPYRKALMKKIDALSGNVFSRNELTVNGTNSERLRLNRALQVLIKEGFIIKIAHGLYSKAECLSFSDGKIIPVLIQPFEEIATEALDKLGVKWEIGSAIRDYNEGKTTQVPAVFSVRLKSRFRGSVYAEGKSLVFERGINAR